jgi:hypothetical protein
METADAPSACCSFIPAASPSCCRFCRQCGFDCCLSPQSQKLLECALRCCLPGITPTLEYEYEDLMCNKGVSIHPEVRRNLVVWAEAVRQKYGPQWLEHPIHQEYGVRVRQKLHAMSSCQCQCDKCSTLSAKARAENENENENESASDSMESLPYPWDALDAPHIQSIDVIGFGSLLNPLTGPSISASNVHERQKQWGVPVLCFGAQRVYNHLHSAPLNSLIGLPDTDHPREVARLGTTMTHCCSRPLNGALFRIDRADFELFRSRERHYSLTPVCYVPFDEATQTQNKNNDGTVEVKRAYVLEEEHKQGESEEIRLGLPHIVYTFLCLDGCLQYELVKNCSGFVGCFTSETWTNQGESLESWLHQQAVGYVDALIPSAEEELRVTPEEGCDRIS